jgi:adenosylcobinamide-GDP ribazoletransferase
MQRDSTFSPVRDLRVAGTFLTRIPVGWVQGMQTGDLSRAAWAFPLVGLIVGAIGGAALYGAAYLDLHPLACAFVGLAVMALITGGLHEDGLADVADGFGGGANKVRILEIMRDSRIGSFGVLALVFGIGIKAGALSGVPGPGVAWVTLIAAAVFSRAMLPIIMAIMETARMDGLSRGAGRPTMAGALVALGLGLITLFAILPMKLAFIALMLVIPLAGLIVLWAYRRLGGQTGDVLGAVQQVVEMSVVMAAAGWS